MLTDLRATDWIVLAATIMVVGIAITNRFGWTIDPSRPWTRVQGIMLAMVSRVVTRPRWSAHPWRFNVSRTWSPSRRSIYGVIALVASAYVWTSERGRPLGESRAGIVTAWMVSIVALILAVWTPPRIGMAAALRAWISAHRRDLEISAVVTALAAVPMFVRLDSYPWAFNGDEGNFALSARDILNGQPVDPFGTGWLGHPNLYFYLEAAAMGVAGQSVIGARLVGAVFGVLAVGLAYVLVARYFGRTAGVSAAMLLGTFHFHLYTSRSALNNGASPFFMLLSLLLLGIALDRRSRTAFVLTGIVIGLAQYFYMGNRVIPVVAGLILIWVAVRPLFGQNRSMQSAVSGFGDIGLAVCGFVVVVMPLAAYFSRYPENFSARDPQVSIFASGWLEEQRSSGRGVFEVFAGQLHQSALIPFTTQVGGQYRGDPPFIGWPLAVASLLGLVVATARIRHMRFRLIVAPYWVVVAAMATTVPPMATNRFVPAIPLICIFAAIAVSAGHDVLIRLHLPRWPALVITGSTVGLISLWSLVYYFHDPNQIGISSDPNTQVSEYLARDILAIDPTATVYFAGPPRMWYDGFGNLAFRTPNVRVVNVEQPWTTESEKPTFEGTIIFVVLPERATELSVMRAWYPDGETIERSNDEVGPLYTVYIVRQPPPVGFGPMRDPVPRIG